MTKKRKYDPPTQRCSVCGHPVLCPRVPEGFELVDCYCSIACYEELGEISEKRPIKRYATGDNKEQE